MSLVRNPNVFYGLGRRRVRRRKAGGSIFSGINDFLKKHQILSRAGSILGSLGVPYAGAVGTAARLAGYGRRRVGRPRVRRAGGRPLFGLGRRRVYRRRGGDLKGILSSAHNFIKSKRLVSSALRHFAPNSNLHKAAHSLGYGRRRVRRRGGDLKSILSSAHNYIKSKRLVSSALRHFAPNSNLHKAAHSLGYGRRRVGRPRRRRGGDLKSILSSAHKFIKDKRIISSGLRHFAPKSNLHKAAHSLGYGMMRHYGGANFFSTQQIARPRF